MYNFFASFTNTNGVPFPNTAGINSSGGGATDGTEFVKIMVDDIWGFFQALLDYTDDTPNGSSEVGASQLLDSILKIVSNITELSSNATHTVENFDKYSTLILSAGCTIARLIGGTGADETNKLLVQNNNTVTVEVDFGTNINEEEIIMQPGQWIEFVYDSEAAKFIFQKSNRQIVVSTAINYTIGDWLPSGSKIIVNCNTAAQYGLITITLPTLADNQGKWYEIIHGAGQGLVMIDGEGAETLSYKNETATTVNLFSSGNYYKASARTTNWILSGSNVINCGFQNRSDWTSVKIGCGVTYDNGSGTSTKNTDWTGMVITEATSNYTAIVINDSPTVGGVWTAGKLYLYELSSTFTAWTNDRKLTASNGHNIDVNEGSGTSKNIDYAFYHGMNISNICNMIILSLMNSSNSYTNASYVQFVGTSSNRGCTPNKINNNSIYLQSGSSASMYYIDSAGTEQLLVAQDYYINLYIDFSC